MKAVFVNSRKALGKKAAIFKKEVSFVPGQKVPDIGLVNHQGRIGMVCECDSWLDILRVIQAWKIECEVEAVKNVCAIRSWAKFHKIRRINGRLNGVRFY